MQRRAGATSSLGGRAEQVLGPLVIDRAARRVWMANDELDLTPQGI
ncbi:MAG: hypothetical protein PV358_06655 [Acidimicrobiales bacterium]|nr:hypothetical protein [Acidimicrobiales bacterium]